MMVFSMVFLKLNRKLETPTEKYTKVLKCTYYLHIYKMEMIYSERSISFLSCQTLSRLAVQ